MTKAFATYGYRLFLAGVKTPVRNLLCNTIVDRSVKTLVLQATPTIACWIFTEVYRF